MTADELDITRTATLGAPKPVGQHFLQKNFQGMWWGAERIWTGDLLRLKLSRAAIAPQGAPHIAAPSSAGAAALGHPSAKDVDPKQLGAVSQGVFMRLDALFTVEVETKNGKKRNECRAAGPLFELADEDWTDPLKSKEETPATSLEAPGYVNGMSTALSQPSPLKLPPLPNPNPTDPVESNGASDYKAPELTTQYDLPQPPSGFKFRPILESDYEAVFSLTLLSGRYYPGILEHPLLLDTVRTAFMPEGEINPSTAYLWALGGLEAGINNTMDPIRYKKDRLKMLVDAEDSTREQLKEHLDDASIARSDEVDTGTQSNGVEPRDAVTGTQLSRDIFMSNDVETEQTAKPVDTEYGKRWGCRSTVKQRRSYVEWF